MEAGQRIDNRLRRHVGDEVVEVSERRAALHRVLGTLRDVEGVGGHDTGDDAPDLAVVVNHVILGILRLDDPRHLPHAVVASGLRIRLQLLVAVLGDLVHVGHDRLGHGKHLAVHLLQNDLCLREGIAVDRKKRVVDVAVAKRLQRDETPL